jgi:hypothetical protein
MVRTSDLRKAIPLKVQLQAALLQLDIDPATAQLDHDPALSLRPLNEDGTDYNPPQHDPRYLRWLPKHQHLVKTTGRKGTSKLSISGGDQQKAAKVKRLAARASGLVGSGNQTKKIWPKRKLKTRPVLATSRTKKTSSRKRMPAIRLFENE